MEASRRTLQGKKATGLAPDYFADSVKDINFIELSSRGVRYLVLDVDHTLVLHNTLNLDSSTATYLNSQKKNGLLDGIFIASNSRRDLEAIASNLEAKVIPAGRRTRKPRRKYFNRVLSTIGCHPEEAVMVGDKLLMDVFGGNRAGMYTVLVNPIGPDIFFDRLIRRRFWNKRYLKRHR